MKRVITRWCHAQEAMMDFCERHINIVEYNNFVESCKYRKCIEDKCLNYIKTPELRHIVRCEECFRKKHKKYAGDATYAFQVLTIQDKIEN